MSDDKKYIKFSLKAKVNIKKGKVLFAEVDSDFADVLLSFLTMPLGTIVKILQKHCGDTTPQFGSLTSLYTGLANLDSVHFWTEGAKSVLLHPRSFSDDERRKLKLDISDSSPFEYFNCVNKCTTRFQSMIMYYDVIDCGNCFKKMVAQKETQTVPCDDGVFLRKASSFLITDDLHIMPNSGLLEVSRLLGDADMVEAETMDVSFGLHEVIELLKFSLISINPLSAVILNGRPKSKKATEFTANIIAYSNPSSLKLIVQKSTNKLLYAEAEEGFVDLLLSFLVIPLGEVERLLSSGTRVKAIDNLYKSAYERIHDNYFKSSDSKDRLIRPKMPHGYVSKEHIFSLCEDKLPFFNSTGDWLRPSSKFPKGKGSYLVGARGYKVMDDLTVTPFCIMSMLSSLAEMKIPVSDVEELNLNISKKEVLCILKASLTSTSALTDALLTPILKRRIKKEKV